MAKEIYFQVTLRRSGAGRQATQRRTLDGMGLTRIGKRVVLKDTPAVRGMIYKVVHLVEVAPFEGTPPVSARRRAAEARG